MTGFGQYECEWNRGLLSVEIKSVNHRYSDIKIRLPFGWGRLENMISKRVQKEVGRGRIDIIINWNKSSTSEATPQLDSEMAQAYIKIHSQVSSLIGETKEVLSPSQLLSFPGVIVQGTPTISFEELEIILRESVAKALQPFLNMRSSEGNNLDKALRTLLTELEKDVARIEFFLPDLSKNAFQRLRTRIQELAISQEIDESRLYQEIAFLAERSDVSEELTRINSHIKQFTSLLSEGGVIGRRLDFLCQELHREANTISSKNQHSEVAQLLILIKGNIDKIREQVQNIE